MRSGRCCYIPVHKLREYFGDPFCHIFPAAIALTGCDTVSALYGVSKQTLIKVVTASGAEQFSNLQNIRSNGGNLALDASCHLVSKLYDPSSQYQSHHGSLNSLRTFLVVHKNKPLPRIPPCESSFVDHVNRTGYQTKIWTTCPMSKPALDPPIGNGWHVECGVPIPTLFEGPAA